MWKYIIPKCDRKSQIQLNELHSKIQQAFAQKTFIQYYFSDQFSKKELVWNA